MALKTVSVDSGTPAQIYARRNEMDRHWAAFADPCDILIRMEERAIIVFNLRNYDDPIVDREFINSYINRRIGEQHERIQRKQCYAGYSARYRRTTYCTSSTTGYHNPKYAERTSWHNGARVVGCYEVLLAK